MKKAFLFASLCLLLACSGGKEKELSFEEIESGFLQIPDGQPLAVYWYWISDNVSEEGVVKDLEAMKRAGITRVYVGQIGQDDVPYGKVRLFSEEWWQIMHTMFKKAGELGIEIGLFNSPGWSQSGGPWVKPNESMRYLGTSCLHVEGPQALDATLPDVAKDAEDVRVIAFPQAVKNVYRESWTIHKQEGKGEELDIDVPDGVTVRSLTFRFPSLLRTTVDLYKKEGTEYSLFKRVGIDRSNPALNVGFSPYAPVVVSLPETTGADFRLVVHPSGNSDFTVELSSQPYVERYPEKTLAKMFQYPLPVWNEYMWEKQPEVTDPSLLVDPKQVVDLTERFKDGQLKWDVPAGEWCIMRVAMCPTLVTNAPATPEGRGLEVDKMSRQHVETHFNAYIGEILRRIPEADRKTFKVVVQDSYETGGENWTDDMEARFKEKYGYDPVPYLPATQGIVVGSPDLSDRFLWDLRRLVADRVAYDFVGGMRDICHRHGLTTWLENYGHWGFPGEFLQYGAQSDEIGGEFWCEGSLGDVENRLASSCGHIYGKNRIWAESFTAGGANYSRYPGQFKRRGDRFFAEGINTTLLHVYIHQPYEDKVPGISASFSTEFNRHNTWFSQLDVFGQYLKRCNFMLQQGRYVADVAYFIGEDAPKMTGPCEPALPSGYSFDYINAEVLLQKASVKDGKLTLESGMQYRVLVLPRQKSMRPELLKQIKSFVKQGLTVVGPAPEYSPSLCNYPAADQEVKALAAELWAGKNHGKGKVFPTDCSLEDVLKELGVPADCRFTNNVPVVFIHRSLREGDIYFLSNQSEAATSFEAIFRVNGKQPELWNPLTNEIRLLPEYAEADSLTTVPLQLAPGESTFIVFRKPAAQEKAEGTNYPAAQNVATLASGWTVKFEDERQGVTEPVALDSLADWTAFADERIKYYSGTATYTNSFVLESVPKHPLYIDLGKVSAMAKVEINGQYAGGVWTYPYRLNISPYVKQGDNTVRIEVVNTWLNRIIGDHRVPEAQRVTRIIGNWANPWNADSPLQPSGLFGPVQIASHDYCSLEYRPFVP